MIPLGSCTMKLNATAEMLPVTWPEFSRLHPFAPLRAGRGLPRPCSSSWRSWLAEITGFAGVSLQPNAGSQGEYAGLLVIRAYHAQPRRGAPRRLPDSRLGPRHQPRQRGHGRAARSWSSPATTSGNIDVADLRAKAERARERPGRADGHLSLHPRRVRGAIKEICADRPRARRPGLHGRRQPERAGRPVPPRRHRRRRLPPEPAQDLLHPARRRRPGHGPDRAWPSTWRRSCPAIRWCNVGGEQAIGAGLGRALGQRQHPADLLGLHRADGRARA